MQTYCIIRCLVSLEYSTFKLPRARIKYCPWYLISCYLFCMIIWVREVFRKTVRPITATFMFWQPITSHQNWPIQTMTRGNKYHHLTMTLHLTRKMTNHSGSQNVSYLTSLSKDYPHPDYHTKQITDAYPWIQTIYLDKLWIKITS